MSLLAILLALFAEHVFGSLEELRRFGWFDTYTAWLRERLPRDGQWDGPLGVVLLVALPVAAVAIVGYALGEVWGVFGFLYGVLVLLYAFGPRDLDAEVEAFADARERGDEESASWHAASLLGGVVPERPTARAHAVIETVLVEAHERVLGIIFWFLVLGPMGAVFYRLSCILRSRYRDEDSGFGDAAVRLHQLLGWVPARLCGLSYALAGSFVDATARWREAALRWEGDNREVLVASGAGALRYVPAVDQEDEDDASVETDNIRETLSLVRRAAVVWLSVLAVFTLAGWAG